MFFEPLPKCSLGSPIYSSLHSTLFTFESVDNTTLLGYRIFVFGCHQEVFDGSALLEVHLYTMFSTKQTLLLMELKLLLVGYLVLLLISFEWFEALILFFILFKAPCWIFTSGQDFLEMFLFFLLLLCGRAYTFIPVKKCSYQTKI